MDGPVEPPARAEIAETYRRIATHFAQTRTHPWPEVEEFVRTQSSATCALDIGCGNGRHLKLLADVAERVVGIDLSRPLLALAARTAPEAALAQGDTVMLPLQADTVDLCLYVATLHHVPTRSARQRSLADLARVLQRGGSALISCWSVTHDKFDADTGHDRWVDWTLPDETVVERFYHIFDLEEFTTELEASPLAVQRTYEASGNCYGIVSAPNREDA